MKYFVQWWWWGNHRIVHLNMIKLLYCKHNENKKNPLFLQESLYFSTAFVFFQMNTAPGGDVMTVCEEESCLVGLIFIPVCANGVLTAPPVFLLLYLSVKFTYSTSAQQIVTLLSQFPALYFQMNPMYAPQIPYVHLHAPQICTLHLHPLHALHTRLCTFVLPHATIIYLHRPFVCNLQTPLCILYRALCKFGNPFIHPSFTLVQLSWAFFQTFIHHHTHALENVVQLCSTTFTEFT